MTARAGDVSQVWLDAWKKWQDAGGAAFPAWAARSQGMDAGGLSGLAENYKAFADSVMGAAETDAGDLSAQFAAAIDRIRDAYRVDDSDRMLGAFLAAVPTAPSIDLGSFDWLDLPAVGPHREWTDAVKQAQQSMVAQQRAAEVLMGHYQSAVMCALDRFADYLRDETGEPITSLKALYDAWIDIAERAYAEVVMDAGFAVDFGAWINTGSEARIKLRTLIDRITAGVDMPQRRDFDALMERQHALTREVESLRAELAARISESD